MSEDEERSASISLGELQYLAGVYGRSLDRLAQSDALSVEELSAGKRLIQFLGRELQRRMMAPRIPPREALWPAIASWDLFEFQVPASHRGAMVGNVVTGTKRLVLEGLKPLHRELVETQRAFNQKLLDFLVWSVDGRFPSGVGLASFVRSTLDSLVVKMKAPKGRRVKHLASLSSSFLTNQQNWNERAVELVTHLLEEDSRLPTPLVHHLLGELQRFGQFPQRDELEASERMAYPLLSEMFRRQATFNASITRTLTSLFGLPLKPDDGRQWYPTSIVGHESRRIAQTSRLIEQLDQQPLLSIITPTWRAAPRVLEACVESVIAQSYQRWELCLVDDGTPDPAVRYFVESMSARDPRIRVKLMEKNGGIARATNEALEMATGAYVGFLDHDDTLAPHALAEVALYLARHPDTDFLYTDEDKLDFSGKRVLPFFKPDWSPDLLRSVNYVCHFLVAKRELLAKVGGVRLGFDGAQDYDLILRLAEHARHVGHIPEVLYHWRAGAESTALNVANKPMASTAGVRALTQHVRRTGERATISSPLPTQYRVHYEANDAHVALVVAGSARVGSIVRDLERTNYQRRELVVVSKEPVRECRHLPWVGPPDLSAMYELARNQVRADVYVFLHEDVALVDGDWLGELVAQAQRPQIGVVGPKLVNPDSTIQDAGWVIGPEGQLLRPFANMADDGEWTTMGSANWMRNYLAVSPACFAVRGTVLEQLGGFTPGLGGVDPVLDLCRRAARAGLRVLYTPHSKVVHFAHSPRPEELVHTLSRGEERDPFFNPHLSPAHTNGALRLFDSVEKSRW